MKLTSVQKRLTESDQRLRELERQAQAGDPDAMKQLAVMFKQTGNEEEARHWHWMLLQTKKDEIAQKIQSMIKPPMGMRTPLNPAGTALWGKKFYNLADLNHPKHWDDLGQVIGIDASSRNYIFAQREPGGMGLSRDTPLEDLVPPELYKLENL